jgi:hypothetical protein
MTILNYKGLTLKISSFLNKAPHPNVDPTQEHKEDQSRLPNLKLTKNIYLCGKIGVLPYRLRHVGLKDCGANLCMNMNR